MTTNTQLEVGLPANIDAERTILGAVLLEPGCLDELKMGLIPNDFSLDTHKRIAAAMGRLAKQDRSIDMVTLSSELGRTKELQTIGGVAYLASLTEGLPRRPIVSEYIRIVKDKSLLRQLMMACSETISWAGDQSDTALQVAGELQSRLEKLISIPSSVAGAEVQNFIVEVMDDMNTEFRQKVSPAIPSGNAWFDAKTGGGYRHGKITLVCARPNVGKTPWAMTSVAYNCTRGRKCVVFSLEMEKGEIAKNLIPYVVNLPNIVVNRTYAQSVEQNRLVNEGAGMIAEWPLKVHDGDMDADQICWTIDRECKNREECLFVIDHFGLIGGQTKDIRQRYNENSAKLRTRIKHKKAALLALCQLRKVNREFADKPPVPDDVKESGNMWEDAFAGLLIHRGFDKETNKISTEANLNLAKLRTGGSTGNTTANFDTRRLEFEAAAEMDFDNYYQ